MKTNLLLILTAVILLIGGCSKDNVINTPADEKEQGKMLLKFNKTETPQNVVSITATLTRTGFQTITGVLNIITDTSAAISLQNIAAGTWHLKVEAKDNSGTVIYRGETDVTIIAGTITQVMLTLQPTGANVGGIYILVNWGSGTIIPAWIDYSGNPILVGTGQSLDINGIVRPIVYIEGNSFKMWYLNCGTGNVGTIGYAISNDGINWTRPLSQPVLSPGSNGSWDGATISVGPVIKVDGIYRMYYGGRAMQGGYTSIGLATSPDGITWTKKTNPVLVGQGNWEGNIDAGDVIKINNTYYMYYTGINSGYYKIGIATSPDGITWTRLSSNPYLVGDKGWEAQGVLTPTVIYDNNKYVMAYLNGKDYPDAFGLATSSDGINWVKDPSNPFFTSQNTYNRWTSYILYPCLRKYNNEWRVYYSGYNLGTDKRFIAMTRLIK